MADDIQTLSPPRVDWRTLIEAIGPELSKYLQQFDICCDYPQTFRLLGVYCKGLLADLERERPAVVGRLVAATPVCRHLA